MCYMRGSVSHSSKQWKLTPKLSNKPYLNFEEFITEDQV